MWTWTAHLTTRSLHFLLQSTQNLSVEPRNGNLQAFAAWCRSSESGVDHKPLGALLQPRMLAGPSLQDFSWAELEQDLRIYIYSGRFGDHPWENP